MRKQTPDELWRLYQEIQGASDKLVTRLEGYTQLKPTIHSEMDAADEIIPFVTFVERQFRGWFERCRDLREELEDPMLRAPNWPQKPEPDPRDDG